jgi:hypothetical protein
MSVYNVPTSLRKSVKAGAAIAKWEPVKLSTEDTENEGIVVIKTAATTDVFIGVALNDATAANQGIDIALPGSVVLMRAGGAITQGNDVGLSGTDKAEIAALTLAAGGGTIRRVIGTALRTGVENDLIPVLYSPFVFETA